MMVVKVTSSSTRDNIKKEVLRLIEEAINYSYPVRWADERTTLGSFDGRGSTIDVFCISVLEQSNFLVKMGAIRKQIKGMTGHRCIFIFHTLEDTATHYSHLISVAGGVHNEGKG